MAADEDVKVIRQHGVVRVDKAWHELGQSQVDGRHPAGEDDVDEHEDFGSCAGDIDEDVACLVVGPKVGQLDGLVAERDGGVAGEGCGGQGWVVLWLGRNGAEDEFGIGVGDEFNSVSSTVG